MSRIALCLCPLSLLSACALRPRPLKVDITRLAQPGPGVVLINCADQETWREWNEKQSQNKQK